jgi:hypothetical protein
VAGPRDLRSLLRSLLATQANPKTFSDLLRDTFTWRKQAVKVEPARVLIVTADAAHRQQVVATLEPRGFEPLLAQSLAEAATQMAGHSDAVRVAVLDAAMRDSGAIERELRNSLPAVRIVVLPRKIRGEMIGLLLIDRIWHPRPAKLMNAGNGSSNAALLGCPLEHSEGPRRLMKAESALSTADLLPDRPAGTVASIPMATIRPSCDAVRLTTPQWSG